MKRLWDAGALLNKWYFLFIILLHSAVCAIIVQNALAFFLNLGLAYLVRGFLSLHFIVNGVESYKQRVKLVLFTYWVMIIIFFTVIRFVAVFLL